MRRLVLATALLPAMAFAADLAPREEVAVFAAGCFWCLEEAMRGLPGVIDLTVGYTGGETEDPSYAQVHLTDTGHRGAVRVVFDPAAATYSDFLVAYWRSVDPLDGEGQFCERGPSHAPAIFAADAVQADLAERSRARLETFFGRPVPVPVLAAGSFWPAEDLHQDYARKFPLRYDFHRRSCGRDARLREVWRRDAVLAFGEERAR